MPLKTIKNFADNSIKVNGNQNFVKSGIHFSMFRLFELSICPSAYDLNLYGHSTTVKNKAHNNRIIYANSTLKINNSTTTNQDDHCMGSFTYINPHV